MAESFEHALRDDEYRAEFDLRPHIRALVARANAAMETAARDEIIRWLRQHGYVVIEPTSYSAEEQAARSLGVNWSVREDGSVVTLNDPGEVQ